MRPDLSDGELVRKSRGERTQQEFSKLVGIDRPMLSHYERGAVKPSSETWLKMAEFAMYPWNVYCWQRGKLSTKHIGDLLLGLRLKDEEFSLAREKIRRELFDLGLRPEPVTEPLGDEPVGGEPASLKGLSETVEQFCARNAVLPPDEPIAGERKPTTPPEKGKRGRKKR